MPDQNRIYRFGNFEVDEQAGELRRRGIRVKMNAQPFQVMLLMLAKPGELISREEIQKALWPEGTFVDFDHGLNSAVNKIREALGDSAASPRFVETLARKGYRFIAPVEVDGAPKALKFASATSLEVPVEPAALSKGDESVKILSSKEEMPSVSAKTARTLFLLIQLMYLGFYVAALARVEKLEERLSNIFTLASSVELILIVTAAVLIAVRLYLISGAAFDAPGFPSKLLKLFPLLLILDLVWAMSPFLLLPEIGFGLAMAACAALVYAPFAQRSLGLMMSQKLLK